MRLFRDRHDAGMQLARALQRYAQRPDVVVLALPRGGVPVGYEVANQLGAPLDVLVVRKLGVPGRSELAMGAVASGGIEVIDRQIMKSMKVSKEAFDAVAEDERAEVERRERTLRGDMEMVDVRRKVVIVVDDGLATGSTMMAAVAALRKRSPAGIVVAVPVAPAAAREAIGVAVDEIVCLESPDRFHALGRWYRDFSQTTDAEVRELLDAARRTNALRAAATASARTTPPP